MKYYKRNNGTLIKSAFAVSDAVEITAEEYAAYCDRMKPEKYPDPALLEKYRPLTESEVTSLLIAQQINTLAVDDNTALRMMAYYPDWAAGVAYPAGHKVKRDGKLWRVREGQAHTSQAGWEPEVAVSLWEQINETHSGEEDDPIPYDGNMTLTAGLCYMQDWVIYRCIRDTGAPVYHALRDLVGLYVQEV